MLRGGPLGVQEWNRLRADGEMLPDLSGVNLSRCNLIGVDLHGLRVVEAHLGGSELDRADLSGADLSRTDMAACRLYCADLRGAILRGANLRSAYVVHADLTDIDLRGADLTAADLSSAELHVADSEDVSTSMYRADRLPLIDEVKEALFEILQKTDILDLPNARKQQLANHVDDLIRELLKSPPNPRRAVDLFDIIGETAPPLVADIPKAVFLRLERVS
jgi:hypothetical protein